MKIPLSLAFLLGTLGIAAAAQNAPTPHSHHASAAQAGPPVLPPAEAARKARRLGLPAGVIQLTPCVPGMGEHWARPQDMPFGPIYGVMQGRVVFVEVMIDQKAFASGQSWTDQLKPTPGKQIDHVNIEFQAAGHEGFPVPHYDIHAYFVAQREHATYCPPLQGGR